MNDNPTVLVWVVASVFGLIFTGGLLLRSWGDYRYVQGSGLNGLRRYSAVTCLFTFLGGTCTQLVYVILGVKALTQPYLTSRIDFYSFIFIAATVLGSVLAAIIFYRRIKIVEMFGDLDTGHSHSRHDDV